jgi:hypothetical protein
MDDTPEIEAWIDDRGRLGPWTVCFLESEIPGRQEKSVQAVSNSGVEGMTD